MVDKLIILIVLGGIALSSVIPSPQELTTYFREGQGLFVIEDYPRAIEKYQHITNTESKLLDEDKVMVAVTFQEEVEVPVKLAATYQLGNAYKKLGEYDQAVSYFEKVVQQAPLENLRSLAQYQIISSRYEQEEYQKAVDQSQKLIDLFPDSEYLERAYYNMGWSHFRMEQYSEAMASFLEQLERFPEGEYAPRAQYQIAQSYYDGENYAQAIENYKIVIDRYVPEEFSEKEWSQALLSRLRKRTQVERSVLKGQEEQNLVELSAKAQLQIGESHRKMGQLQQAVDSYRLVTQNFLPLTDLVELAYLKMAETSFDLDGLDAAVKIYRDGLDSSSDRKFQAKMQYKIAKLYFEHQEYERAAQEYQVFIDGYSEEGPSIGFSPDDAQYSVGLSYYHAKLYQRSSQEYQKIVDGYPDSPLAANALYGIGLNHQLLGDAAQAEEAYQQVVDKHPEHDHAPLALLQLARLYFEQKQYPQAKAAYMRLAEEYQEAALVEGDVILYELGLTCRDMGDVEDAIAYLRRIDAASKLFAAAVAEINEIYIKAADFQMAEQELATALEKTADPAAMAQIRYGRARLFVAQGEYRRALEDFGYVIEHVVDENIKQNAIFARGVIYFQFEEYEQAIADLELLMTTEAELQLKKEARQKLGVCYLKTGQKDRAISLARRLLDSATNASQKAESYLIMADLYFELKEFGSGVESARQVLGIEGVDDELKVQAYYAMGNCRSGMKDYSGALQAYSTALNNYPQSIFRADLLFQAGIMSYNLEDYNASAEKFSVFAQEFGEHPNTVFALYYLAYSQFRRGLWDQARETFGRVASQYPNSDMVEEAHYQVAECYYNERQYQQAMEAYRHVLSKYAASKYAEDALYNVAWCQFQLEDEEEAINTLQEVVRRFPQGDYGADALFTIGDYHYNKKDYALAQEAYQQVIDLYPDSPRAHQAAALIHELGQIASYVAYQKAVTLFDDKRYLAAIEAFETIIDQYPGTDVIVGAWANIGASYEQLSRWDDALEVYNRLIEIYSDVPEHRDAVAFATEHKEWIEETF
jgi:tetratricopeptide (TPR) repeat protein